MNADDSLPNNVEVLKQLVRARDAELARALAEVSNARAEASAQVLDSFYIVVHYHREKPGEMPLVIPTCELQLFRAYCILAACAGGIGVSAIRAGHAVPMHRTLIALAGAIVIVADAAIGR